MTFPVSPANNDTATVNGITYVYSSATNSWARTTATSLTLAGNLIANKLFTTTGLFWSGNGFAVSTGGGGGGSPVGDQGSLQFNDGGSFNGSTIIYDTSTGNVVITDTTDSTSTTTGALVVIGGVGVGGSLHLLNTNDVSANIGTLFLGNVSTQANLGAYQGYANANIGTLYLGNVSTQANLGAYQNYANLTLLGINANIGAFETYANTKIGNNSDSNLVVLSTTTSTSTTTGALVVKGGVGIAGDVYATSLSVAPTTTLSDALNLNNNNIYNVNTIRIYDPGTSEGITWEGGSGWYIYESPDDLSNDIGNLQIVRNGIRTLTVDTYGGVNVPNTKAATSTTSGALTVGGGLGVAGNIYTDKLYTTNGLYWAGNGEVISTGGGSGADEVLRANVGAYQLYANANIGTLYLDNISTQANLGAFQSYANANIGTIRTNLNTLDANVGAFETYANTKIGNNSNGNLVVVATTAATNTTTGALVVGGGVGIAGSTFGDKFYTANGIFWSGNGAPYSTGTGGGGGTFTASASAPSSPSPGDFWYKTTTDVLYEYINDGTSNYWIDIQTQTIVTTTNTPFYTGDVFGGNISFTGSITGNVGYLLEKANVVASAAPAVTNLDLLTAPIAYFTSNSTQNITANIRGNSTVTLNSMLATGQSATFVIFVPNALAYYISTVKIDNTTVTPYWQGGSAVSSGNADSIDIYTFAVLKTANATFKVFASQVRYQNLGP